ncbi:N-terminal glutamine amidase-domain-containing protein [Phellopilus nigrolimitatus]|nr:N-terminal glutamine amidase-domain-containing protein [Phellopilus nigrolimitatus]
MSLALAPRPPPLPPGSVYTANWCEENIYLLASAFLEDPIVRASWHAYAIFISNPAKTVALWSQKQRTDVVVWDYHVVLMLKPLANKSSRGAGRPEANADGGPEAREPGEPGLAPDRVRSWVYDFDSRLPMPCPWEDYVAATFPYTTAAAEDAGWTVPDAYRSVFRVVRGEEYVERFASDRTHMLAAVPGPERYVSPPPAYACIQGAHAKLNGISNNLMSAFVDMDAPGAGAGGTGVGEVYGLEEAIVWGCAG